MGYGFKVEFFGPMALFTRPEFKVERSTYEVITPSAARGMLDSVYFHPGMRWVVDAIHVLNPIQYMNIRRNEVKSKISGRNVRQVMTGGENDLQIITTQDIAQRAALVLTNVRYVIEAHFEMTDRANASDNHGKFTDIIKRRLNRGSCYSQPYFGCREFTAYFEPWPEDKPIKTAYENEIIDLGYMLYDMDYSDPANIEPLFFHAVLTHGMIDLREVEVTK